ncbi:bifunctional DNA-formamidopyrimidine glycosylase/DNA-(apurinic or apyrimidinic site) lyase [Pedosphaera parvula]|uniref:Formamidopyrimidine-DNA glycosylase n=1 Tax=Pedosphaera parvula (strain Ellin514) TaxID=320771 RepID=B9XRC9_PEDPL|nr:bifunctional DNA-formamidopyrimidine glycosylase/DNA-(apurinic or apyrimidinic site) lyase [Pedosphaera parvula]EEF57616.1 formamidopyrimidine-DNA glycosylase [Pedosphaera parvula Ellin514]
MPELPEVEILVRHLAPLITNKKITDVEIRRSKVLAPTTASDLEEALTGARFTHLSRRGKYLLFFLKSPRMQCPLQLLGHLGMTGRMYLLPKNAGLPKHAAVILGLGRERFVFEDTRYFGRFTLDTRSLAALGPEPWSPEFTDEYFHHALKRSTQPVKVKLLDQSLVAGVGNIYASEALYRAGISPKLSSRKIKPIQAKHLRKAIQEVLEQAIQCGSTLPLDFVGIEGKNGHFYYGSAGDSSEFYQERLLVYDRLGQSCGKCGAGIKRFVQAARSTFYCPRCQRA